MPAALPLRSDFDSETLRSLARHARDSNQSRRLLSLAAVYDGMSRGDHVMLPEPLAPVR